MKAVATVVLASLALAGTCHGGEVVRELPWTRPPAGATLVAPGAGRTGASLRIERRAGGSLQVLRLENPPIATPVWAVVGEVRYEGVAGDGYLEMWSVFKDGRFFSRTLDQAGPMSRLSGASGWREFVLPFFSRADLPPPVALEVNLVLPGAGTVEIGTLRLVQYAAGENPLARASGAWWSDRQGGWIGGVAGAVLGVLGSVVGWLASKGRAPAFVLGASRLVVVLGGMVLVAGLVAIAYAQPYAVWYPLLLVGAISCGVMAPAYRRFARRYRDIELRRLQAFDAR
jgi:hypothetical protein